MTSTSISDIERRELYKILSGAIAPRPIAFASTVNAEGQANLAPYSFFNMIGSNPPTLVFSPNVSGRTGAQKHTLQNMEQVPEVVINLVSYDMLHQMNIAGLEYPAGVNEFDKSGFTPVASAQIRPPRVAEAPVQLECVVKQIIATGTEGGAGNIVVAEIVHIHIDEGILDELGAIDPFKIDLIGRMGGDDYVRCREAIFRLPKTAARLGIGFDSLPENARQSELLSGNELGQLARLDSLPTEQQIAAQLDVVRAISAQSVLKVHQLARRLIRRGEIEAALALLIALERC